LIAAFHQVLKLSNDGVHAHLAGKGDYADKHMAFHIDEFSQPEVSRGTTFVKVKVRFLKLPPKEKIYNSDGEWVTPGSNVVTLNIPFDKPAAAH